MGLGLLLDTHALLWALMTPEKLSGTVLEHLENAETRLHVSSVSAWELSIKHALGKLAGAEGVLAGFSGHLAELQAGVLVITPEHALTAGALPPHHRDPFDRMLVAQAQTEGLALVSSDRAFDAYEVLVVW